MIFQSVALETSWLVPILIKLFTKRNRDEGANTIQHSVSIFGRYINKMIIYRRFSTIGQGKFAGGVRLGFLV